MGTGMTPALRLLRQRPTSRHRPTVARSLFPPRQPTPRRPDRRQDDGDEPAGGSTATGSRGRVSGSVPTTFRQPTSTDPLAVATPTAPADISSSRPAAGRR